MSILIKGMEMPKEPMVLILFPNGNISTEEYEIGANAKAIELPPHGRLIDAERLKGAFLDKYVIYDNTLTMIDDAPTIIEADDSFFNSLKRGLEQAINGDVREMNIIEAEDDGYFTAEEQKLMRDVVNRKSQKTGINIYTIIEADDSIKRAEWEKHNDGIIYWWECSKCHHDAWYDEDDLHNYCPWCGAKMESEEE